MDWDFSIGLAPPPPHSPPHLNSPISLEDSLYGVRARKNEFCGVVSII